MSQVEDFLTAEQEQLLIEAIKELSEKVERLEREK